MKIVTWNCNGAFRKKYHWVDNLNPDIAVIQECEDPSQVKDNKYRNWATNYHWIGKNKNKGLGVFAKKGVKLERLAWPSGKLELFLPCKINDTFNLLSVWTRQANSPTFQYIGQFWQYLQINRNLMKEENIIIAGDFNSNSVWDVWDRWWNHSDVMRELEEIGIKSIYHTVYKQPQGKETAATFYMYRKSDKPYHIDYILCSSFLEDKTENMNIGSPEKWLEVSDHMPIEVELELAYSAGASR